MNLLKQLLGLVGRQSGLEQLIDIVLHEKYYDPKHKQALKTISQLSNRDELIPIIMDHLHKGEKIYSVVSVLEAIGIPATFEPLLEVFRSAEPSQYIDDGIRVKRAIDPKSTGGISVVDIGTDIFPASALVKLDPLLEKIKATCTSDEFERILLLATNADVVMDNPLVYQALVELATPKIVGRLIARLYNSIENSYQNRGAKSQELAKQSLISIGESALPRIRKAIAEPFYYTGTPDSRYFTEKCFNNFHKELESILAAIIGQSAEG